MVSNKKVLQNIVDAWENLDEGHYSAAEIQNWLVYYMKPAIDKIRKILKSDENEIL